MYTTLLEKLGVQVSRLGFGAMRFPTHEDKSIHKEKAFELLDCAYQNGVNYFDTAYPYHGGTSEEVLGEFLSRYPRESYYLADKLPVWACKTIDDVEFRFQKQLTRCGVDYFDFYLMHAVHRNRWKNIQEIGILDRMEQYRREGRIRFLGFSFHDNLEVFREVVDAYPWDFVQIQDNFIDDKLQDARALYELLTQRQIPCIVMEPVRGGMLAALPEQAAAVLREAPADSGAARWREHAHWALRWCLGHDNMRVVLSGMSTLEQVEQNVALFSEAPPLSPQEADLLERARDIILSAKTIPCTGCRYCKCPQGVHIPEAFDAYNIYRLFGDEFRSKMAYSMLTTEHNALVCTHCGACLSACPQKIDIPGELANLHQVIANLGTQMMADVPAIN